MNFFFQTIFLGQTQGIKLKCFSKPGCAQPIISTKIGPLSPILTGLSYAFVHNTGYIRMNKEWVSLHFYNTLCGILSHEFDAYMYF